jgi:hypothetical protein
MTPRKVPLNKIYFLEVENDIEYVENELTIDEAFRIVSNYPSWKVIVFQDGYYFKLRLSCMELAGEWEKLARQLQNVYWRSDENFIPTVECDNSNIEIEIKTSLPTDENCSEHNTCIYTYLEDKFEDIDWSSLYTLDNQHNTMYTYLVEDRDNNLAILDCGETIESPEILEYWIEYYYDILEYDLDCLDLGKLLTIHSLDDRISERFYKEYIKNKVIILEIDDENR